MFRLDIAIIFTLEVNLRLVPKRNVTLLISLELEIISAHKLVSLEKLKHSTRPFTWEVLKSLLLEVALILLKSLITIQGRQLLIILVLTFSRSTLIKWELIRRAKSIW